MSPVSTLAYLGIGISCRFSAGADCLGAKHQSPLPKKLHRRWSSWRVYLVRSASTAMKMAMKSTKKKWCYQIPVFIIFLLVKKTWMSWIWWQMAKRWPTVFFYHFGDRSQFRILNCATTTDIVATTPGLSGPPARTNRSLQKVVVDHQNLHLIRLVKRDLPIGPYIYIIIPNILGNNG